MLRALDLDALGEICARSGYAGTICILSTCRELSELIDDDGFFGCLARRLFSDTFWKRAVSRSVQPPRGTWKGELARIERFQLLLEKNHEARWPEDTFFRFWEAERSARLRVGPRKRVPL